MRKTHIALLLVSLAIITTSFKQGPPETWRKDQLIEPSALAKLMATKEKQPIIFSIGFGGGIKNSVVLGPARDSATLLTWKAELAKLPKDANIVIYCGCCPFEHCPNVRPAFSLLNDLHFTNAKLLNLAHNLKADWIDKGYPVESKP